MAIKKVPHLIEGSTRLAKTAHQLLKMQSKFFTKKMKEKPPIIQIVSDVFCQAKYMEDIDKEKKKEAAMKHMAETFNQDVRICQ